MAIWSTDRSNLQVDLQQKLLSQIPRDELARFTEAELRAELTNLVDELHPHTPELQDLADPERLIQQILDEVFGFGPIAGLMRDHEISEILINGPRQLFIEKCGQLQSTEITFRDDHHFAQFVRALVAMTSTKLDGKTHIHDARLPDGSRVNIVMKPPALNGPVVCIRRFGVRPLTAEDLLANESITTEMLEFLSACVKARISMVISGGSGSGKTTLLNALSRYISNTERIITIEDTAELELQKPHVVKMESQLVDRNGPGELSMRDLVKNALRMRPDRIIVGECRGAEVIDMFQAMNTGHEGSMTTIHANSTREALSRVELMIGLAGLNGAEMTIRRLIASSVNLVIQVSRHSGGKRRVVAISEITGMEGETVCMHNIFEFVQTGIDQHDAVTGYFRATGLRPEFLKKLKARGASLPAEMFIERRLQTSKNREPGR